MSIAFQKLVNGFLEAIERSGSTVNTVRNYRSDLATFGAFLETRGLDFQKLGLQELESYHEWLKAKGLKPNSRRRKIMTLKTFLRAVSHSVEVSLVGADKVVPPEKVEKPPRLVPEELIEAIYKDQPVTDLGARNRALLGVMLDTGALVTEVLALRRSEVSIDGPSPSVRIAGGRARRSMITERTRADLADLLGRLGPQHKQVFYGYSKAGPNAERLTARGVEALFKGWARHYGVNALKPRVLRHLYVMRAFGEGRSEAEIMAALGLRTSYVFKIYRPLLEMKGAPENAVTQRAT